MNEFKKIEILFITGKVMEFKGKYRPDLERPNWHYYEDMNGKILHCRKEHMVAVGEEK